MEDNIATLASSRTTKGLENRFGENNCFLNVVIQSLWHLKEFRRNFKHQEKHNHPKDTACIFCALEFHFAEEDILPPIALRSALSELFSKEAKFQLGKLADAAEAFDEILTSLHVATQYNASLSSCEPPCFIHQLFSISIIEQQECPGCKATSEPLSSNMFIYYVYTAALRNMSYLNPYSHFDMLLKKLHGVDTKLCTSNKYCSSSCRVHHYLMNRPRVFTIGLAWNSDSPLPSEIADILNMIEEQIDLTNIFEGSNISCRYKLKGLICYYGKHYDAYSLLDSTWWVFDDATVKTVGTQWTDVKKRCMKGHFQPAILFYELQDDPIPKSITRTLSAPTLGQQSASDNKLLNTNDHQQPTKEGQSSKQMSLLSIKHDIDTPSSTPSLTRLKTDLRRHLNTEKVNREMTGPSLTDSVTPSNNTLGYSLHSPLHYHSHTFSSDRPRESHTNSLPDRISNLPPNYRRTSTFPSSSTTTTTASSLPSNSTTTTGPSRTKTFLPGSSYKKINGDLHQYHPS